MVFKPRQKRLNLTRQLLIDNQTIDQVKETVSLDVVIDGNLSWKAQISSVMYKVSKSIGIINKSSFYI